MIDNLRYHKFFLKLTKKVRMSFEIRNIFVFLQSLE